MTKPLLELCAKANSTDNRAPDPKYLKNQEERVEMSPFGTEGIFINNEDYPCDDAQQ